LALPLIPGFITSKLLYPHLRLNICLLSFNTSGPVLSTEVLITGSPSNMGGKSIITVLAALTLSCVVENVAVQAFTVDRPAVVPFLKSDIVLAKRSDEESNEMAIVKRATVGLSTDDPTLQRDYTWYWGVDGKQPRHYSGTTS
jgi:hypothetical protein